MAFAVAASWVMDPKGTNGSAKRSVCRRTLSDPVSTARASSPVLLVDVMDTLVVDPFSVSMHSFFGFDSKEDFLKAKSPGTWIDFEKGGLAEDEFVRTFFRDGRPVDMASFRNFLLDSYRWIEGMEQLMSELNSAGVEMHILSNYPVWWTLVEERCGLAKYTPWSFVSCNTGLRKPDPEAFLSASRSLGQEPANCVLLDDRASNCESARQVGYRDAIVFEGADSARAALGSHFPTLTGATAKD